MLNTTHTAITKYRKILQNYWNCRIYFQGFWVVEIQVGFSKVFCLYWQTLFSVVLKEGVPKDDELEALGMDISDKWTNLGRRLNIEQAKLQAIAKDFDSLHERGFQMLKHWKQKQGSGANYKSLSGALKHKLVERKDLAEKYCFKRQY